MRGIIINKQILLLKACIFSGLAVVCLTANAEETAEYASVPPIGDCHYAEHPIVRETVRVHYKYRYRRVTHHHYRIHHRAYSSNGLAVYFPFSSLSYDEIWPSDDCACERNAYYVMPASSDDITYNLMYYGPLYENRAVAAPCDE